ncbi:MAG: glycine cleavage system aminomethyltransferase GcvT [Treponemataceae bacterium]
MKRTPYFNVLTEKGGKFVEFGGFEMPVQFDGLGIIAEHLAVRNSVGVFDVSHMGQFYIEGDEAEAAINELITNDIRGMLDGQIRYTLMCNEAGGIVDDFLVYRYNAQKFMLVVNAGNRDKDFAWIKKHLKDGAKLIDRSDEIALLAIQGPNSEKVIKKFIRAEDIPNEYYTFKTFKIPEGEVLVSRTGYTGEDGFEVYCPAKVAIELFDNVMKAGAEFDIALCGLGCRDTLRLEAGMPLYGHEMTEETLATEVTLKPFVKLEKESFIGKKALLEKEAKKIRKGFKLVDKGIAREGAKVFVGDTEIGCVTTGTQSPSLKVGIGHMRIDRGVKETDILIDVRGRKLKAVIHPTSFLKEIKGEK